MELVEPVHKVLTLPADKCSHRGQRRAIPGFLRRDLVVGPEMVDPQMSKVTGRDASSETRSATRASTRNTFAGTPRRLETHDKMRVAVTAETSSVCSHKQQSNGGSPNTLSMRQSRVWTG